MKTTLAKIVRNFEILPVVPEHKFVFSNDAVLRANNGYPVQFKMRN